MGIALGKWVKANSVCSRTLSLSRHPHGDRVRGMESSGWQISKSELVAHDKEADALTRFQQNVLNPALNSAVVEPWNTVVSTSNTVSSKLNGKDLLSEKEDFDTGEVKFLSTAWLVQSASGGLAMLLPYAVSGKAAGGFLEHVAEHLRPGAIGTRILQNEATAQILGAAVYDGLRATKPGETHLGNAAGGVTAFGTFAIGNAISKDLPLGKMLAVRTLSGAIGGGAQHVASALVSGSKFDVASFGKASVNGVVMSIVLPESQRIFKSVAGDAHESFGMPFSSERLFEANIKTPSAASAAPAAAVENQAAPGTYDFFVKVENVDKVKEERTREEIEKAIERAQDHAGDQSPLKFSPGEKTQQSFVPSINISTYSNPELHLLPPPAG